MVGQVVEQALNSKANSGEILYFCCSFDLVILNRHEKCDGMFNRMLKYQKISYWTLFCQTTDLLKLFKKLKNMTEVNMIHRVSTLSCLRSVP